MARGQRSVLSAASLVGFLGLAVVGAHGITQGKAACTLNRSLVVVDLDDVKHHHIIDHALDARRAGHKRILHIRRYEATANRRASLRGIATKRGYDRDEYPPAMADEGGKGADVRYVLSAENRSAGSVMRRQLTPDCNEQRFIFARWRNR
jgi:Deoxyribonuclease NucA/NucB